MAIFERSHEGATAESVARLDAGSGLQEHLDCLDIPGGSVRGVSHQGRSAGRIRRFGISAGTEEELHYSTSVRPGRCVERRPPHCVPGIEIRTGVDQFFKRHKIAATCHFVNRRLRL